MRSIVVGTFFVLLFFVYGFYVSQSDIQIIPPEIEQENPPGFYDYKGIANVQTNLSQGSSTPTEVAAEALKTDLDFLILTDVNLMQEHQSLNSYFGKLLVMSEAEYTFLDSRVLFISDTGAHGFTSAGDINLFMTDILSQPPTLSRDGIAIHAHPFDRGNPTWTGAYPTGLQGLEILNPKSMAAKAFANSKLDVLWSSLFYFFDSAMPFCGCSENLWKNWLSGTKLVKKDLFTDLQALMPRPERFHLPTILLNFQAIKNRSRSSRTTLSCPLS